MRLCAVRLRGIFLSWHSGNQPQLQNAVIIIVAWQPTSSTRRAAIKQHEHEFIFVWP